MSQENVEIAYRGYELVTCGDIEAWLQDLREDVELRELPEIPDSAVYRGHDGVRKWAAGVRELVESWHWTPEEILHESDDALVVRVRLDFVGRGSEIPVVQVVFHVLRFQDGKTSEVEGFLSEHAALEPPGSGSRPHASALCEQRTLEPDVGQSMLRSSLSPMSPIPGEPLDPKPKELTTSDGRKFKVKVPGLTQPPEPGQTEERGSAEPPREDPRPLINPDHVGP